MKSDTKYRTGDEVQFARNLLKKNRGKFISYAEMGLKKKRSWDGTNVNVKRLKDRLRTMLKEIGVEEEKRAA